MHLILKELRYCVQAMGECCARPPSFYDESSSSGDQSTGSSDSTTHSSHVFWDNLENHVEEMQNLSAFKAPRPANVGHHTVFHPAPMFPKTPREGQEVVQLTKEEFLDSLMKTKQVGGGASKHNP